MPRWYGLTFALVLMWVLVVTNGVDNILMLEEGESWLLAVGQFRGVGAAALVSVGLVQRRRWGWWTALAWFAVAAALFAAISTEPAVTTSVWLATACAALAIVGFLAVLNGRDELQDVVAPAPED